MTAEEVETLEADAAFAYKLAFGQSEADFENQVKIVDRQIRTVCEVTLIKGSDADDTTKSVFRVSGATRYETSLKTADELKDVLGVEQFDTVIIATGTNFADALAGSYLANVTNAPILLINDTKADQVTDYIKKNVKKGGTVYVLGGTAAVSDESVSPLVKYNVKRLEGKNRYETNLAILAEAGVAAGSDILVATGTGYADSLSASAAGRPILLVGDALTDAQAEFLAKTAGDIYVIGGEAAVNAEIESALAAYGTVERLGGANRYATSVLVAEAFFDAPEAAVLAYAMNYPDGLCAGPLAAALDAPMILAENGKESAAAAYAAEVGINIGYVLGGDGLISDDTARTIFGLDAEIEIEVK